MSRQRSAPGVCWNKRLQKYVGQWMEDGKRRTKVLSRDRETAEKIFRKLKSDADLRANGLGSLLVQRTRLAVISQAYLKDLELRVGKQHHDNVTLNLEDVIQEVGVATVADLTIERAQDAQRRLVARDPAISRETANKKLGALCAALNWAVRSGMIQVNPIAQGRFQRLSTVKHKARVRHVFTREEARRVLAAALRDDRGFSAPRRVPQAPMLRLLLGTGFRLGEAWSLRWSDLTRMDETWRLTVKAEHSKTETSRTNPIDARLHRDLMRLRARQGRCLGRLPSDRDFIILSPDGCQFAGRSNGSNALRWLNRIIKSAKLPKRFADGSTIDFYSFRHTYCTWLRMMGVGYSTAQDLMGHSDDGITRAIYTRLGMVVEPKVDAIAKLAAFSKGRDKRAN